MLPDGAMYGVSEEVSIANIFDNAILLAELV